MNTELKEMYSIAQLQTVFADYLKLKIEELNATEPKGLYEPVTYTLDMGGKRLRPVFVLLTSELVGGNHNDALDAALAIEVFHNFTLLHDDIMDKAEVRRGRPTVHRKYSENTSILSGDAMSILAYKYLGRLKPEFLSATFALFSTTALEVCEGQQYDMEFEDRNNVAVEEYIEMIRLKTAVLLAACLKMGAIVGKASKETSNLLYDFGINIGLAFQLQDDLLDTYGDQATFGKRIGGDILCNKKTFMLIRAMETATGTTALELNAWLEAKEFNQQEKIAGVTAIYDQLGIKEMAELEIESYYSKAIACLDKLEIDNGRKAELYTFSESILKRIK